MNKYLFSLMLVLLATPLMAQPPSPPATPIDGGLGLLLAGGVAYGLKRVNDLKKKK